MNEFTEIEDNTLLPFGANQLTLGDDNTISGISITEIFEDGITFGSETYTELGIATNGFVSFSEFTPGFFSSRTTGIAPFDVDLDTRGSPSADTGVFWDFNTERDSVVVTWNEVGRFSRDYAPSYTFQLELIDLGNGDSEIVFRYADMGEAGDGGRSSYNFAISTNTSQNEVQLNGSQTGIPAYDLDTAEGNTGVAGVWQFRLTDGIVEPDMFETGTEGNDELIGTSQRDAFDGLGGDDVIRGGSGRDRVLGGDGDDLLFGGLANDSVSGGAGDDQILESWSLDDGARDGGDDRLDGNDGNDIIQGAWGNDTLFGGDGDDRLQGGQSNDDVFGGAGDDVLAGGQGNDTLDGGAGDDFLFGDVGVNEATGGAGADTFLLDPNGRLDITDFSATDGDRLIVDGDVYDRDSFFLRPAGDGLLYDADANLVVDRVDILFADPETGDRTVIAEIAFDDAPSDGLNLYLPTTAPETGDVITWDIF